MAITNQDIVLYQSQDNTDNDNGGGARTGVELADGLVNNLFPDISRIDTVGGDVALRKLFMVVDTDTREIYYGAHSIIRKTPDDPKVSALLFHTDDPVDVRSEARSKIEAYLVPSYKAPFYLFGTNVEGAGAVTFLQRIEEEIPSVGDVFLIIEGAKSQYIRIANVDYKNVPFFFNNSDYIRRRLILTIEQPLEYEFVGSSFNPAGETSGAAETFTTQQASGAKFYGTKNLAVDVVAGSTTLTLDSIYESLVPATKQQVPLVNIDALQQTQILFVDPDTNPATLQTSSNVILGGGSSTSREDINLNRPVRPNSFVSGNYSDNGDGTITASSGDAIYNIDYKTGLITYVSGLSTTRNGKANFKPASVIESRIQYSTGIKIDASNQGNTFVRNVAPTPKPEELYVDYRSNGKWYRIQGNTDGSLGADGLGGGQLNVNNDGTGTIAVTLAAIPDLNSTVIFSWGSTDSLVSVLSEITDTKPFIKYELPHNNIDYSSVRIAVHPFAANPTTLNFSNSVDGAAVEYENSFYVINTVKGELYVYQENGGNRLTPAPSTVSNPDSDTSYYMDVTYDYEDEPSTGQTGETKTINDPSFTPTPQGGDFSIGEPVVDETVIIDVVVEFKPLAWRGEAISELRLYGDKDGNIYREGHTYTSVGNGQVVAQKTIYGTIAANGDITLNFPSKERRVAEVYTGSQGETYTRYVDSNVSNYKLLDINSVQYKSSAIATFTSSNTHRLYHADARIIAHFPSNLAATEFNLGFQGGVNLNVNELGQIYKGSTIYDGSFDFNTGVLEVENNLDFFTSGFDGITQLVTTDLFADSNEGEKKIRTQVFRTGSQDLVTSSFQARYETINGSYTATTNSNGEFISGTDLDLVESYVDTTTGMAYMVFTDDVFPETIKYDAVAQTTLPLDADLLGLNPIRLPADGRVPLFEPARFVVVFQEDETAIATPVANATASSGKTNVALLEVIDVNGQRLDYAQYTQDKVAGDVTFADPLNLVDRQGNALTGPYRLIDRIEDMGMCVDSDVTGVITLSSSLNNDYIAGQARVASALVWGDVGSRVFNLFSQTSFDVWSDSPTQNPTTAQYDNVNYPIQVDNQSSFSGRWAIIFQSSSTVDVVSEKLGVLIENAPITSDISPINPATGNPYFTIPSGGWGGGWTTSQVLRFNTESGDENFWVIRTVQSGTLTEEKDDIDVEIRGDAN